MLPPAAAPSPVHPQPGVPFPGPLVPSPSGLFDPYGKPAVPPAMQSNFDPFALLQALQRRWLLASVLGLLVTAGVAAGAYWFLWQPVRWMVKAEAYVFPTQPFTYDKPPDEPEGAQLARLKQEATLAQSGEVIQRALRDPELEKLEDFANLTEDERLNWIVSGRFGAYPNEKENTITLMVSSTDNERWLVPIANALLRAYLSYSNELELAARQQVYQDRYDLYMKNGGSEAAALESLKDKQRQQVAANPGVLDQRKSLLTQRQEAESEKAKIINEIEKIKIDMELRRDELGDTTVTADDVQAELEMDEKLRTMLVELTDLQDDIEKGATRFADGMDNPIIKKLQAQLAEYQVEKDAYLTQRTQEIRDELSAKRQAEIQAALKDFVRDLNRQNRYLERVKSRIASLTSTLNQLQDPSVDTQALEEALKAEPYFTRLRDELDKLAREKDSPARVCHRQDAADPPSAEPQPAPYRKVAMAGFGALAVVLGGISLLEYRTRRIHTVSEVVQGLGLRLLGAIPAWSPPTQQRSGYGTTLAYNLWTESVDTARTMVTHAAQAESARVVMVTSATSGEGKTSLSSHLASSLARAGHRTLLVDGDLRSPAIHALFDVGLEPGLCEVLRGQIPLEDAIRETPAGGLSLLTAGQWDSGALQALAQQGAQDIFARLKEQFDYVIVDSSPVLAVADALMIGRHVDGVLISILRDVSRVPTVYAAYQRLTMLGIRTLGAVVNGARSERYGSWYNATPTAA